MESKTDFSHFMAIKLSKRHIFLSHSKLSLLVTLSNGSLSLADSCLQRKLSSEKFPLNYIVCRVNFRLMRAGTLRIFKKLFLGSPREEPKTGKSENKNCLTLQF